MVCVHVESAIIHGIYNRLNLNKETDIFISKKI
jgi:hypothetical protein